MQKTTQNEAKRPPCSCPPAQPCEHERWLVERLAAYIEAGIGSRDFDKCTLAWLLGIATDDVDLPCALGLVGGQAKETFTAAELVAFLKAHGEAWYRVRIAKYVAELEACVEWERNHLPAEGVA